MGPELLVALKALSDASRLRILGLLAAGRPLTVRDLSEALGWSPRSVTHHLGRLRDADLVTIHPGVPSDTYALRLDRLASIGRELDLIDRQPEAGEGVPLPGAGALPLTAYEATVLRAFLVDGRLERIPAQHQKRQVVLRFLAQTDFRPGEELVEKEVNMRLALRHPDVASLRRYLVEDGYMERPGGVYRLLPEGGWPTLPSGKD